MQASQPQGGQSQGSPLFSCDIIYPRVVSDALSTIQLKRGQTALCTASHALGVQFSVELARSMQAKVTLKDRAFSALSLERDIQFKINLSSLLDSLNVFSHSLVKDNPLQLSYGCDGVLSLRLFEVDHEAICTIQTLQDDADTAMEDIQFGTEVASSAIITSEALRDAFAEIDWTIATARVRFSAGETTFSISVESPTGFAYGVKIPGGAAVFTEFDCKQTQENEYNLNQLRHCVKALALSAPTGSTSIRMNDACMLFLQHMIEYDGAVVAFVDFVLLSTAQE